MADKTTAATARQRARDARAALAARKREQQDAIEQHQLAYFAADDEVRAVDDKIAALQAQIRALKAERDANTTAARERQRDAIGALVIDAGQPAGDVAVLLGISENQVKKACTAYRKSAPNNTASETPTADESLEATDAAHETSARDDGDAMREPTTSHDETSQRDDAEAAHAQSSDLQEALA